MRLQGSISTRQDGYIADNSPGSVLVNLPTKTKSRVCLQIWELVQRLPISGILW